MKSPLRILYLEDNKKDVELVQATLAIEGITCEWVHVETRADFIAALQKGGFDMIFADHSLPSFDGISALAIAQGNCPEVPFIFLSGVLGEELAIETLKSGATDYVLKQRLSRLVPSVRRALREVEERTERKRAEQALRLLYEQTKKQAEDLQKANRVKDEFLSVVSHELRTPLNVIMGYTKIIEEGTLGEANQEQKKLLGKVMNYAKNLSSMISGILQAATIEADAVRVESHGISLWDFCQELRSTYDIPLGQGVAFIWDYPSNLPVVRTDREKLKHILQNLINNALKFTKRGHVTISVRCLTTDDTKQPEPDNGKVEFVEFKVADTGIGIAKEMIPVSFEMFRQLDSSGTRPYGGVGLGLYIVKKFTELIGGKIDVESEVGQGSTFTLTIPV